LELLSNGNQQPPRTRRVGPIGPWLLCIFLFCWCISVLLLCKFAFETKRGLFTILVSNGTIALTNLIIDDGQNSADYAIVLHTLAKARPVVRYRGLRESFAEIDCLGLRPPSLQWQDPIGVRNPYAQHISSSTLIIPFWLPAMLSFVATIRWLIVGRSRIRRVDCECCRYDLTGNTSGICSECGVPIPKTKKKIISACSSNHPFPIRKSNLS
jgi:hypothetical protein